MGIGSLPVRLGVDNAALLACVVMAVPQVDRRRLLFSWDCRIHAGIVALLAARAARSDEATAAQPRERATWYSATGVTLYVAGMLVSAFALCSKMTAGS